MVFACRRFEGAVTDAVFFYFLLSTIAFLPLRGFRAWDRMIVLLGLGII